MEEGRAGRSQTTKPSITASGLASTDVFFSSKGRERERRGIYQ